VPKRPGALAPSPRSSHCAPGRTEQQLTISTEGVYPRSRPHKAEGLKRASAPYDLPVMNVAQAAWPEHVTQTIGIRQACDPALAQAARPRALGSTAPAGDAFGPDGLAHTPPQGRHERRCFSG